MSQIFNKAERERIHSMLSNGFYPASLQNYIQALEVIAQRASIVWEECLTPFQQVAMQELPNALDKVDWMREHNNKVMFVREWNCHFHVACLPDSYPTKDNVHFVDPSGMDHVVCFGCKESVGQAPIQPVKGKAPSYAE